MALSSLRLRRTLCTLRRSLAGTPPISPSSAPSSSSSSCGSLFPVQSPAPPSQKWSLLLHSCAFRSSSASLSSSRLANGGGNNQDDDIVPGTIMTGKESENSDSFSILRRPLAAAPPIRLPSLSKQFLASSQWPPPPPPLLLQSRRFRSSTVLLKSSSLPSTSFEPNYTWSYEEFKPRGLGIDAIEGCDFNHWLIVMDFPKDPKPSPEEMVRSYEETCAKALGIRSKPPLSSVSSFF